MKIKPQKAFEDLYKGYWREMSLAGGRGSAKSWEAAQFCIMRSLQGKRVLCLREIQNSISESVHALLCDRIEEIGAMDWFDIQKTEISSDTGGMFLFKGLHRNIDSIKSMHNIEVVWIEEAQTVTTESLNILLPTIYRNNNPQIIYTWNPRYESDAVYQRFCTDNIPEKSIHKHLTWRDNKYFSDDMKEEMAFNFKVDPEMANHTWEGALFPSSSESSVIPLAWLKQCVGAHKKINNGFMGHNYLGFDVADTGKDHSAIAYRRGPLLLDSIEFDCDHISESVERVDNYSKDKSIARIYFDATGIGAGAKSDFNRLSHEYIVEPFLGAAKVHGYDKYFVDNITNGAYFRNAKAQAWWNIRLRAENTLRILDGENISPEKCLFINENITNIDKLLLELSQATYKHEDSKLLVDKHLVDES